MKLNWAIVVLSALVMRGFCLPSAAFGFLDPSGGGVTPWMTLRIIFIGPNYSPLTPTNSEFAASTATTIESHDTTVGVSALSTKAVIHFTVTQGGDHSLGTYDTGGYLIGAYADGVPVAAINVYPSITYWSGDLIQLTENLINGGADYGSSNGGEGGCFISDLAF